MFYLLEFYLYLMFPYCFFSLYSRLSHTFVVYYGVKDKLNGVINVIKTLDNYSHSIFVCKCRRAFEPTFENIPYQRWKLFVISNSNNRSPLNMFALREEYQIRYCAPFDFHKIKK